MKVPILSIQRLRFASTFGLAHLAASAFLASLVAALVFWLWFPYPYRELTGGRELFWLIIAVDVACGPLLTWVVAAPHKTRRDLLTDVSLVATIQVAALVYGLFILSQARPVALVFEADRFRAVTSADIDSADLARADLHMQSLPLLGPRLFGVRSPANADESFEATSLGLSGLEPSMRPQWWVPYAQAESAVRARAKPVDVLRKKYATHSALIDDAVQQSGLPESDLLWVPLVSRRSLEWVVLLDKTTAQPKAYAPLDGFF